jgi:hypothetical protein
MQGGFRGALTGFAVGFGAASAYGYVYLLREYHEASSAMVASVQELQESTQKVRHRILIGITFVLIRYYHQVTSAFARVSALEEQVQRVDHRASSKEEVLRRNSDLVRVYDALHEDVLEIRRKLYDIGGSTMNLLLSRLYTDPFFSFSSEQDYNRAMFAPLSRQANGRLV